MRLISLLFGNSRFLPHHAGSALIQSRIIKIIAVIAQLIVLAAILDPCNLNRLARRAADGSAVSFTHELHYNSKFQLVRMFLALLPLPWIYL